MVLKMFDHKKSNSKHQDFDVFWKGSITCRVRGFTLWSLRWPYYRTL